jgi:deoxyribodipyrimidine photo-lyase
MVFFWFRRDLRLEDNAGLYHALRSGQPVLPVFIFDRHILDGLADRADARVTFLYQTIVELKSALEERNSTLLVEYGTPETVWPLLLERYPDARAVYTNRDYEPYATERDTDIQQLLNRKGLQWRSSKDHVIFEKDEVLKDDSKPYTVFTPYSKKWRTRLAARPADSAFLTASEGLPSSFYLSSYPTLKYESSFLKTPPVSYPALESMGFTTSSIPIPPNEVARGVIQNYNKTRDYPGQAGSSRLGIHFRFGTISIREKARRAQRLNDTYLNELIWRDFYSQILAHFPHVTHQAFRPEYDRIVWRNVPGEFERWKEGTTGYPLVDAGMRELRATGYMHNRVRMVTASFLSKHLLTDWRLGEAWFAEHLLDYDLASNVGGWQWAAGCGTDAAPYFRIFNPTEQAKKFDPQLQYIRKWVPEYGTPAYPAPVVDHVFARNRCLATYRAALSK